MRWKIQILKRKKGDNMPGEKILVVDDDKKVTEGVGVFLKSLGHDMLLALDGEQAMNIINKEKPALVLLDIQLPKINGIEILTTLRQKYRDIKVFVITAYSKDLKWRCDEIGYDKFFAKPIELDPLLEAIKEIVLKKKIEEEKPLKGIPKAKILFVEPNIMAYALTCALFKSKEFCKGEYEIKEIENYAEILDTLYDYQPDIVVIYDTFLEIENWSSVISRSSHKPKLIIMHGIVPRTDLEIIQLEKQGIIYCNQYVMTDEEFRKANMKLIDLVGQECLKNNLVKE